MAELLGLAATCFLAATLLPFPSEGALLAYLLIRLSGIDREVMEKWLYVIVGLTFISGLLGTAFGFSDARASTCIRPDPSVIHRTIPQISCVRLKRFSSGLNTVCFLVTSKQIIVSVRFRGQGSAMPSTRWENADLHSAN